jgi:hypothetical protein
MTQQQCPNCDSTSFKKEKGIANKEGDNITWYKSGVWWGRLVMSVVPIIVIGPLIGQLVMNAIPNFPGIIILFVMLALIGGATIEWIKDMRAGISATRYICKSCGWQGILRKNESWSVFKESLVNPPTE